VVVRLITRDDEAQVAAAEQFVAPGAWVSLLVLSEVSWVLDSVYGLDAKRLSMAIEMLLSHEHLTLEDADTVSAALVRFRARPSLGFSDCLILEHARMAGHLPLGTLDRSLAKLDGAERLSK
jgi:predicted nucleic-acid-binding protein